MTFDKLPELFRSPWWIVVGILLLLLVWEGAKKWVPGLLEWLAKQVRNALAGTRVMHGRALRTYRERVAARYARLPVLFMPDKGIDVTTVYVPLHATDDENQPTDAYDWIRASAHSVVLGPPGSGKSMLLRHSMLTWSRDPSWRREQRVPVLIELIRLGDGRPPEDHIVAQLAEDGFAKAEQFVRSALAEGRLSVLFDGFDEVSSHERDHVARLLRSFAATYPDCQIVVTCRTAIYHRQLAPEITTTLHVAEFQDRHIHRFLRQWPGVPDELAVERLLAALRDAPRIMQLARNPLLLTMIAYLYGARSGAQTVLPHSRAEFYHEAIDILLDRLKDSRNTFKGAVKKAVLIRLATAIQATGATEADRRTLSYEDVVSEVMATIPKLNIAPTKMDELLDEIVDRSGLLLRLDGGSRFQFAHLSLQEYLVAVAHEQDRDGLIANYQEAPGDWREVIKLWCGVVSVDCAPLLESVFRTDPLLAFECLADAQVVDETVADRIVDDLTRRFGAEVGRSQDVVAAFGLVAADPRPRGRQVLAFLTTRAREHDPMAHAALAATKLPSAAETLLEEIDHPSARTALIMLGDLAVPALMAHGGLSTVDLLGHIGTPAAAVALARLIFTYEPQDATCRAAWYLAAILENPEVQAALDDLDVPEEADSYLWVWEPFRASTSASVARIAARAAYLCDGSLPPATVHRIDPRLAIPLLVLGLGSTFHRTLHALPDELAKAAHDFRGLGHHEDLTQAEGFDLAMRQHLSDHSATLYGMLDRRLRVNLVTRMSYPIRDKVFWRILDHKDWKHVDSIPAFRYVRSGQFWTAWLAQACILLCAGIGLTVLGDDWSWGPLWSAWATAAVALIWFLLTFVVSLDDDGPSDHETQSMGIFVSNAYWFVRSGFWVGDGAGLAIQLSAMVGAGAILALPLAVGAQLVGLWVAVPIVLLAHGIVIALVWHGIRREQSALNPLRGLLELDESAARRQTSIIAS